MEGKGEKREKRGKSDISTDERRFTQMGKKENDGRGEELTTDHTDGKGKKGISLSLCALRSAQTAPTLRDGIAAQLNDLSQPIAKKKEIKYRN
ncbi:MAG: hypothetical protein PF447_10775 [Spirochaetaceae bacterium]|jgi:hypothetical protein|nr:hypothetical protein [Spirochaetaceae bacterium]